MFRQNLSSKAKNDSLRTCSAIYIYGGMIRGFEVGLHKLCQTAMALTFQDIIMKISTDKHHQNQLHDYIKDFLRSVEETNLFSNALKSTDGIFPQ